MKSPEKSGSYREELFSLEEVNECAVYAGLRPE
jgi:hypothetical protein